MYDAIIIGAGLGGLISALTLQEQDKKVLLIERGENVGGLATSFVRGRFEFEVGLKGMVGYNKNTSRGSLYQLLKRHNIDIEVSSSKDLYTLICTSDNKIYKMPLGAEEYTEKMEEYVKDSKKSMQIFFSLIREVNQAINYIEETNEQPNKDVFKREFRNFMAVAPYSLEKILDTIHMPSKAKEILSSYALYLGCASTEISFVHYALIFNSLIQTGFTIPNHTSYDITLKILERFKYLGGNILLESEVKEILVANNHIKGVVLKNGQNIQTNHIICNISPRMVFNKMISPKEVPKMAKQLENYRSLGARGISVYLGLNKSASSLNLDSYMYLIYETLSSQTEFKKMKKLFSKNIMATVYNNACPTYSEPGTCIIELSTLIYGDDFTKQVNKENYLDLKDKIANHMITLFEEATKIKIRDYIEEIEVATPLTYARYTNHLDGVIFGYAPYKSDSILPRKMNSKKEQYIKGLRFCGGFGTRLSGITSSLLSGEEEAINTLKEMSK